MIKKDGRSRLDYILMICQWHLRVGVSVKKLLANAEFIKTPDVRHRNERRLAS